MNYPCNRCKGFGTLAPTDSKCPECEGSGKGTRPMRKSKAVLLTLANPNYRTPRSSAQHDYYSGAGWHYPQG